MPRKEFPRLLIFDSGMGGLTVLAPIRAVIPEADIVYLADDAGFPYGAIDANTLTARLCALLETAAHEYRPDAVVVACNTASTIALPALRGVLTQPVIGTVPAIKPAATLSRSGFISVLGTAATVRRDYTKALIAEFAASCNVTLVGSAQLANLAEQDMMGDEAQDKDISAEIAPCFIETGGARTDVVVLACTHYPLLKDRFDQLAPWPVIWLDPAPAIARRTANVLSGLGFMIGVGAIGRPGRIIFTSGKSLSDAQIALLGDRQLLMENAMQCR